MLFFRVGAISMAHKSCEKWGDYVAQIP